MCKSGHLQPSNKNLGATMLEKSVAVAMVAAGVGVVFYLFGEAQRTSYASIAVLPQQIEGEIEPVPGPLAPGPEDG
jgi:hypothetical protein